MLALIAHRVMGRCDSPHRRRTKCLERLINKVDLLLQTFTRRRRVEEHHAHQWATVDFPEILGVKIHRHLPAARSRVLLSALDLVLLRHRVIVIARYRVEQHMTSQWPQ
jgi:hypothetical protein